MSRKARVKSQTGIYHVILRGVNRQNIFVDDQDRLRLLDTFAKYKRKIAFRLFAYCLMSNHIHLLIQECQEAIGMTMKRISASYVFWYNSKYDRCGHLFQERFRSEPVDTDSYFLTLLRYIHQNPVKAHIVDNVAAYKWSSYREYTDICRIIDRDYVLKMFADNLTDAVKYFDEHVRKSAEDGCLDNIEQPAKISDSVIKTMIRQKFGVEATDVGAMERDKQDDVVRELKKIKCVKIRQIARLTGLSPVRVWRT